LESDSVEATVPDAVPVHDPTYHLHHLLIHAWRMTIFIIMGMTKDFGGRPWWWRLDYFGNYKDGDFVPPENSWNKEFVTPSDRKS
jgi:hypothetical protein